MKKGIYCTVLAVVLTAAVFLLPIINHGPSSGDSSSQNVGQSSYVIADDKKNESSAPEIKVPKSDETVTFIIRASGDCLLDNMKASAYTNMLDYLMSRDSREAVDTMKKNQAVVKASIRRMVPEAEFENCFTYNTVFNGFSVRAPYSVLPKLQKIGGIEEVILASAKSLSVKENDSVSSESSADAQESKNPAAREVRVTTDTDNNTSGTIAESIELTQMVQTRKSDINESEQSAVSDVLIAVIDDGFDITHKAFSSVSGFTQKPSFSEIAAKVSVNGVGGSGSALGNVVFSYDYAGRDTDTKNPSSDHGTGIASLIAGRAGTGKDDFCGVAPGAQLALMKVCADGVSTTSDDVLLAAIDDAAKLSPDIINISMGASGLSNNASVFTPVYEKLSSAGIIICAAAGNEGTLTENKGFRSTLTDYGTVSYPSSLSQVLSAGAFVSSRQINSYLSVGEEKIVFTDFYTGSASGFEEADNANYIFIADTESDPMTEENCSGRIIVLHSSPEGSSEAISKAAENGSHGVIFIGTPDEDDSSEIAIPVACADKKYLSVFEKQPEGSLSYAGLAFEGSDNALSPAEFTSYGTSPDLTLKPDLLAPGTDVAAAFSGGYRSMDGTSVSSAELSGAAAAVLKNNPLISGTAEQKSILVRALLMNNAALIKNTGKYISPRLQGSGRLDLKSALQAQSVLLSGSLSSVSMGADADGSFSFEITLRNLSDAEKSFTLSSALTTDKLYQDGGVFLNSLEAESIAKHASVSFTIDGKKVSSVSLAGKESKNVSVSVELNEDFVQEYMTKAENGFYIDGFIFAREADGSQLHIPLTGFCGDLSTADMFDSTAYESKTPVIGSGAVYATAQSGNAYPSYPLGHNMTTDNFSSYNICIGKDTVKNYTDDAQAGTSFIIPNLYLLRNAENYTITITDKDKKELYSENIGSASPFTDKENEPYTKLLERFNSDALKNLFAELEEGSYTLSVSASPVSVGSAASANTISFDFRLDNTAPTSLYSKTYIKEGRIYLDLHAADVGGVQGFRLYTAITDGKSYKYADDLDSLIAQGYISADCISLVNSSADETTADYTYDITGLYHQLSRLSGFTSNDAPVHPLSGMIIYRAVDYAYNLSDPTSAATLSECRIEVNLFDGDEKPVKGAVISNGVTTAETDKNGKAVFEDLTPDLYSITIRSLPEGCTSEHKVQVVTITDADPEVKLGIPVKREFYVEEEESSQPEIQPEQSAVVDRYIPSVGNPAVPIIFVGVLLAVCSLSLVISKIKRR